MSAKLRLTGVALGFFLIAFTTFDLYWPREVDLRAFDPSAVGKLEARAWKAYYDRDRTKLVGTVAELLRTQFHFPYLRAFVGAYRLATAAGEFQESSDTVSSLKALPSLRRFYEVLCKMSKKPCRPEMCAQKELAWWLEHRRRSSKELVAAVAAASAELYAVNDEKMLPYAEKRVVAMRLRDGNEAAPSWAEIEAALVESYRRLYSAVNRD